MTKMFLPFPEEQIEADLNSSAIVDPTTDVEVDDGDLEDAFLK